MGKITVAIVEDHSLTMLGIRSIFAQSKRIQIAGEATTAMGGLQLLKSTRPDVAIIDLNLPDMSGVELIQRFQNSGAAESTSRTKVIILTAFTDEQRVLEAFAIGADSYCVKTTKFELLIEAVYQTHNGLPWIDPAIARTILNYAQQGANSEDHRTVKIAALETEHATLLKVESLTEREMQVLRLMVRGCTNLEIVENLHLSLSTIKCHIRGILGKLYVSDRTQAAVVALRSGLVN